MPAPIGRVMTASSKSADHSWTFPARPLARSRTLVAAALVSLALAAILVHGLGGARTADLPRVRPVASGLTQSEGLPLAAQGPISNAIGADSTAYRVRTTRSGLRLSNPAQDLWALFGRAGVTLGSAALREQLSLDAVGYGSSLTNIEDQSPAGAGNRVAYARAGLSEWYANGPFGLEQGFTLQHAPSGRQTGPLTLAMALSGNARAALADDGQDITLSRPGATPLHYGALTATDARGRTLRSWLELESGRLLLRVDARGAHFPLRIDPLVQQAYLEGSGEIGNGHFGRSTALSADGNTALVGTPHDNGRIGAVWVFTRTGSTWTQQAVLEGSNDPDVHFGRSVALSSDGNTALIGDPNTEHSVGAAWIFTRTGSTWAESEELVGGGENGPGEFGARVALSGDADTALIGGWADHNDAGAAWVFTRVGSSWVQQGAKLLGGGESGEGEFGHSVALSGDGGSALIGAPADAGGTGAAWLFTRSGSSWVQQGAKLEGGEEEGAGGFGASAALSADGTSAVIGGAEDDGGVGAAWAFAGSGSSLTQLGPKLTGGSEEIGDGQFGYSVALTPDGSTALIGALADDSGQGSAWLFTSSGSSWTQHGSKLTGFKENGSGELGWSVALDADAGTALVGGLANGNGVGAAWVFSIEPPSITHIEPREGPTAGGTTVTIKGSGFTESSTVRFGSAEAADVEVESPTRIKATSPAGTDLVNVTVTNINGTSATGPTDWFDYVAPPTVNSVAPGEGPVAGGTAVTITGSDFKAPATVRFGSLHAVGVEVESPTRIKATSPADTGTVNVTVTTVGGPSATGPGDRFSYIAPPPPPVELQGGAGGVNDTASGGSGGSGVSAFFLATVPPPILGRTGNVAPVSGRVYIRLPGASRFVRLTTLRQIPFGTIIDARHGHVSVVTAGPHGGTQTGEFFDGEFVLTQTRRGLVVAALYGGSFRACPTARERRHLARISTTHTSGKHVVRQLWSNAHGSFSSKGNYAAGAVQGTEWLTEDLCDGTLIKVTRDKVKVTDLVHHHSKIVKVGHSYLAKAP